MTDAELISAVSKERDAAIRARDAVQQRCTSLEADAERAAQIIREMAKDLTLAHAQVLLLRDTVRDYYNACAPADGDIERINRRARSILELVKE
jgi:hypothetical protein